MYKKILVLSDSHGNLENMRTAIELEKPDMIIHAGDMYRDAMKMKEEYPDIPLHAVPGNCDYATENRNLLLEIDGVKVFVTHGHDYGVKSSYLSLGYAADEQKANVIVFGHTHTPYWDYHNRKAWLNPGSIGSPRYGMDATYGILVIENGEAFVSTCPVPTKKKMRRSIF